MDNDRMSNLALVSFEADILSEISFENITELAKKAGHGDRKSRPYKMSSQHPLPPV